MKASWSGYVRIGDLTIPARLSKGTRASLPRFVQLHAADHAPIRRVAVCEQDGEPLEAKDIIRAVEHNGTLVEISDSDLHAHQSADKHITIRQFTTPLATDPMYYERPYYIVPAKGGELAYTLLREALHRAQKVAIAVFVFYEREHLGVIHPHDGILMLEQLRFATELVPRANIKTPGLPQPTPDQVDLATQLVERYSAPFYIEDYRNEQADHLEEIIERKAKGLPMKRPPRIARHTTPEAEITKTLHNLLRDRTAPHLLDTTAKAQK